MPTGRDRGEIDVAAQVLVYPMLDDRSSTADGIDGSGHRLWTQTSNLYGFDGVAPKAPVSQAFTKSQIDFLRQTLKQTEPADA